MRSRSVAVGWASLAVGLLALDTLVEIFDDSIVWHLPGTSRYAEDYQGRDG